MKFSQEQLEKIDAIKALLRRHLSVSKIKIKWAMNLRNKVKGQVSISNKPIIPEKFNQFITDLRLLNVHYIVSREFLRARETKKGKINTMKYLVIYIDEPLSPYSGGR